MLWALLGAYLTKRPPWVQAVVFGLGAGMFTAAVVDANRSSPAVGGTVLVVLAVGVVVGALFYVSLTARLRHGWTVGTTPPRWVSIAYIAAWTLSLAAAVLALIGAGGFKVAVLAIVPIVLLAPPALVAIRTLAGRAPQPQPERPRSGAHAE